MNIKQSKQWGVYLKALGWGSLYIPQAIRIKKLLFWSLIKIQHPRNIDKKFLERVDKIAKENKALFVKLEPSDNKADKLLNQYGYLREKSPLSPTKTIILDATLSEESLLKSFSKDVRQKLKQKQIGTILKSGQSRFKDCPEPVEEFYRLFKNTGKRKRFWVPSLKEIMHKAKAFRDTEFIILAYKDAKPIAGAFVLTLGSGAFYQHAATNRVGHKHYAAYHILWEVIKECKKRKIKTLDLEGIYDERFPLMTKSWKKFTVFKKKWGGGVVEYPYPRIIYYSWVAKILKI